AGSSCTTRCRSSAATWRDGRSRAAVSRAPSRASRSRPSPIADARTRRSGARAARELLEPLDGLEILLDEVVDDLAHGTDAVHLADDLADRVEHHVLRLVGVAMHAGHRAGPDHDV